MTNMVDILIKLLHIASISLSRPVWDYIFWNFNAIDYLDILSRIEEATTNFQILKSWAN